MSRSLKTYIRTHRRRHGLDQDELALLLGFTRASTVSKIEHNKRMPSAAVLIAAACVFSTSAEDLFPAVHAKIRYGVRKRAEALYEALQGIKGAKNRAKLDLLEVIIRASDEQHNLPAV